MVLWESIYIDGTGAAFPREVSVESAIAAGRYDPVEAEKSQQLAVTVADPGERAPDLAVSAARTALARSRHSPADVGVLLHSVSLHNGVDAWNSASYVQTRVASDRCFVAEVRDGCAGGMAGLELACSYLVTHAGQPAALVTTADTWPEPQIDRWQMSGCVLGDGGTAVVVARERGFARLVATAATTDSELEALARGDERFGPQAGRYPIDVNRRGREFLARTGIRRDVIFRRLASKLCGVVDRVTGDAGVKLADIEHIVYSFIGRNLLKQECLDPLGIDIMRTTWQFGRRIGHIGPGDAFAGLNHLIESGRLARGERVLLIGMGAGFIWTVAIIEAVDDPPQRTTEP